MQIYVYIYIYIYLYIYIYIYAYVYNTILFMSASRNRRAAIGYRKLDRWRDAGWSKGQSRDSAAAHSAPRPPK